MAHRLIGLLALILGVIPVGCVKKDYPGEAPVVSAVELEGADAVDPNDVLGRLATASSPRFLGIWDGVVFDYEVFDQTLLEHDLERIERYYRARGYYEAQVTAARVVTTDSHHVRVELRVVEGTPVLIAGDVTTPGLERLPFAAAVAANRAVTPHPGDRFDEAVYERSKADIVRALADDGYAFAKVEGRVQVDIARHEATVRIDVTPGPHAVFGPVRIVGLKEIPEGPIRRNLDLREGKDYSRAELEDSRTALVNLGVFATVDVRQDLSHPEKAVVPVTVTVEEAPLRTFRLGAGINFDVLEASTHLTIGWEHQNFLGGLRRLKLELKPGLVFYPTRMDNFEAPRNVLPEGRLRAQLEQPAFLEGRTRGFVSGEFDVYPLLYPELGTDPTKPENVIGYVEVKTQVGASRAFFGHHLYLTPSYSWQANFPFVYLGETSLRTVHVSYPELDAILDFRDDPIEPHRGFFLSNTVQVAGYLFGGDASDVKVQPELRTYVPISKSVTFATRATIGFLFPTNYGGTLSPNTATPQDPASPGWQRDQQILLFRAFYSGGPNSNRGYPFRGVGPQGVLGYLLPSTAGCQFAMPTEACFRPLGGLTLWEASAEVRFPIVGPLRAALFVDASDVTRAVGQIRFTYPHLSPGIGLRYATPVGPIRLDVGYRVPYLQQLGVKTLLSSEGTQTTVFGAPIAVSFALGESF